MPLTVLDLADFVKAPTSDVVESAWDTAVALVGAYCGEVEVPVAVKDRACLETGAALFRREKSGGAGGGQFAAADGTPVMYAKDPMVTVYPLLRPWVGGGLA